ncbi:CAP domain-containing protein [Tenuibacillus multivorans]|uniref:Uncharacterized protein, YkwD family n=1 Tax=Tenuibacillus multivorans TaxID=237069 RepID=A0A1H0DT80_9BACI|nr:CAP domain-containing protein [Tenuibacillus multivorans]GEL76786.1 hypothetical protein TMU01_10210 [Tenuibacillus multivorans]SDN73360.1 uncharacterized protein, YkwD family [Tenuibacillus multivorans]
MFKLIKYAIILLIFGFLINSLPNTMFNTNEEVKSAEETSNFEAVVANVEHLITSVDWVEVTEKAVDGLSQAALMLSNYLEGQDDTEPNAVTTFQNDSETQVDKSLDSNQVHEFEHRVHELVNEEREKHGLDPLEFSVEVSQVARTKSQDMADNNYFSHESPTYGSPFDMMKDFGVDYWSAGENIAMGQRTPEQVMDGWMNSDGHRENILQESFTHLGVGFIKDNGTYYWTQMFIGK